MKTPRSSNYLTVAALILSLAPLAQAEPPPQLDQLLQQGQISPEQLQKGSELINSKFSKKEQAKAEANVLEYVSMLGGDVQTNTIFDVLKIKDLSQEDTTEGEENTLKSWADMYDQGTLKGNIAKLLESLKKSPTKEGKALSSLPPEKQAYATQALNASVEAVLKMRGLTQDSTFNSYQEWSELSKNMIKKIDKSQRKERDILDLAKSEWIRTEAVEILVNGPASFAKRDQLIKGATKSISILTWSIYDDVTGKELVDQLIAKKQENPFMPIRVIVDGQVALNPGHGDQVTRLEKAGIAVVRWFSSEYSYVGQHRKMLIVDDQHLIAGGLNFGDVYSHKNPDLAVARWRDTDVYLKGAGAAQGNILFAKLWNEQIPHYSYLKMTKMKVDDEPKSDANGIEVSIINHDPIQYQDGSPIMLTILRAIREAKQQVDIENAYIILFPALRQEVEAAIKRGVLVRVFTNSGESVDEPVVSIPILRSVAEFVKMGAKVYTKKGTTLHSKILAVDSSLAMVMSYNLHPRSERVEGEMAVIIRDAKVAQNMHQIFDQDVTADKANLIEKVEQLTLPKSPVTLPILRIFFDML